MLETNYSQLFSIKAIEFKLDDDKQTGRWRQRSLGRCQEWGIVQRWIQPVHCLRRYIRDKDTDRPLYIYPVKLALRHRKNIGQNFPEWQILYTRSLKTKHRYVAYPGRQLSKSCNFFSTNACTSVSTSSIVVALKMLTVA